ncbi:cytochrome P450 [Irpex rosettiformis]|uniref:Cytochrome P450 n=1 Tax=Irpex rosettiformis TaxID=378272 RepID=A0ACB8U1M0_9APHY|nr:cytochrome P450 [Irpex rosettiformis]
MISITSSGLSILLTFLVYVIYRRYTRTSVKHIRGPRAPFWQGNIRDFSYQTNVGDLDFQYARDYGLIWRMGGPFGRDVLLVADPKALQHIFHKSGYLYAKSIESDVTTGVFTGHSILTAHDGHSHSRHRKVMNPAFSAPQLRSFLPKFRNSAAKLCRLWKEQVLKENPDGTVIAVNKWLARTTLDVLGETAFQFEFGALDDSKNEVSEAYDNMFADSMLHPSLAVSLFRVTWWWVPRKLLDAVGYIPTRENSRFRKAWKAIEKVASVLVDNATIEAKVVEVEKGKKDVMSVLVRANTSENPSMQLSKHEMVSEMSALTIAGHETTANTLTWLLWELSKQPKYQAQLREEIKQKREEILEKNGAVAIDFSMEDLESMVFLQALLKEILRFHPIVYHLVRYATKDDVIPLSEPITTATGEVIHEIPIPKGQMIQPSFCTYNRIKSIWGEDADVFNPMRFIDGRVEHAVKVGIFSNLMSFSAGVRGCIGWRFSLIEMQAIIVSLVENFEFSLPPTPVEILRMPIGVMSPMVKGKLNEGVMMPLTVRAIQA